MPRHDFDSQSKRDQYNIKIINKTRNGYLLVVLEGDVEVSSGSKVVKDLRNDLFLRQGSLAVVAHPG